MAPALGDPHTVPFAEAKSSHGVAAPVSYVPAPALAAAEPGRPGGRKPEETRKCQLQAGVVVNAAGSAYIEQGKTKVLSTVYGPRQAGDRGQQSAEGHLLLDVSFAPFCSRHRTKEENDRRAQLYSPLIQKSLESVVLLDRYNKLAFDISILVLEDDGAVLTAALAAASLALADGNVEMRDLAAGATVHLAASGAGDQSDPVLLLDCDGDEERRMAPGSAVLHLGLCPTQTKVCLLHCSGPAPPADLERMVLLAKGTAEAVSGEMRRCLEERVERRAAKRARKQQRHSVQGAADAVAAEDEQEAPVPAQDA